MCVWNIHISDSGTNICLLLVRFLCICRQQIVWCDEHIGTFSIFKGTLRVFEEEIQTQNFHICNINNANAERFIFSITE